MRAQPAGALMSSQGVRDTVTSAAPGSAAGEASKRFVAILNETLHALFEADPRIVLLGEDLLDPYGGAFKVSRGLSTRFPDRVLPTPISEGAIIGIGAGMALRGFRPMVEI